LLLRLLFFLLSYGLYAFQQFDRSVPEYETVLTPSDFELGAEIADNLRFIQHGNGDSDAMYGRTRFEGDIANENASSSPC
ncbi:hypothetical protein ANCDUO_22798, partial [Ancylostoma duodenale]